MPKQAVCISLQIAVHVSKTHYFIPNWHYRSSAGMLLWVSDKCFSGFQESIIVVCSKGAFPFMSHKTGFCKVQSAWGTWSFEKHLSLRHTIKARGPWEDKQRAPYIILCVTAKLRDTHDVGRSITSACETPFWCLHNYVTKDLRNTVTKHYWNNPGIDIDLLSVGNKSMPFKSGARPGGTAGIRAPLLPWCRRQRRDNGALHLSGFLILLLPA